MNKISSMQNSFDVVIVGAGLSGLSCGIELAEIGKKVLILEKRNVVGGRTSSWNQDGMYIESGLHRYLGFFEHFPNLLKKAGKKIDEVVVFEDKAEFRINKKLNAVLGLGPFTNPIETIGGLITNNDYIPPKDKLSLGKFFADGFLQLDKDPENLDSYTVLKLARENNVSDKTIVNVLRPLTEGLFFLKEDKYSALNFFALFAPYLKKLHRTRVGSFKGGMSDVLMQPLVDYFKSLNGQLLLNQEVEKVVIKDNKVSGIITSENNFIADNVVIATSLVPAKELVSKFKNPWFDDMISLKTMPSVTFQIDFSEPSTEADHVIFSPSTILSAFAEQSRTTFPQTKGRLSVILADPHKYIETKEEVILEEVITGGKKIGLNISKDTVLDYKKVVWEHDFYSYEAGTYKKRPTQKTPINGLYLAGDYTKQKYLQTMEGAVYSGKLAAREILK